MLFPLFIVFEDVETILGFDLIVETKTMSDLIFLLYKIQLVLDRRVVFIPIFAHLEQHFDHILYSLIDIGFVKNVSKLVEHRQSNRTAHFLQMLSNLSCKTHCNLNAVVRRLMKKELEDLGC